MLRVVKSGFTVGNTVYDVGETFEESQLPGDPLSPSKQREKYGLIYYEPEEDEEPIVRKKKTKKKTKKT